MYMIYLYFLYKFIISYNILYIFYLGY